MGREPNLIIAISNYQKKEERGNLKISEELSKCCGEAKKTNLALRLMRVTKC
jgi:hypothetical protein